MGILIIIVLFPFTRGGYGTGLPWLDKIWGIKKPSSRMSDKKLDRLIDSVNEMARKEKEEHDRLERMKKEDDKS